MSFASAGGPFRFQLAGDAGRAYAIQSTTNVSLTTWTTVATVSNFTGTIWFTNPGPVLPAGQFFRASLLP